MTTTRALAVRKRRRKIPPSNWDNFKEFAKEATDMLSFAIAFTLVTGGIIISIIVTVEKSGWWFPFILFFLGLFCYFFLGMGGSRCKGRS